MKSVKYIHVMNLALLPVTTPKVYRSFWYVRQTCLITYWAVVGFKQNSKYRNHSCLPWRQWILFSSWFSLCRIKHHIFSRLMIFVSTDSYDEGLLGKRYLIEIHHKRSMGSKIGKLGEYCSFIAGVKISNFWYFHFQFILPIIVSLV